jgi:hypothetical protein
MKLTIMFSRKFQHSLTAALLFYVVSSPFTYKIVDKLIGGLVNAVAPSVGHLFKVAEAGCPTNYGLLVHSVVFGIVSFYLMHASS